MWIKLRKKIQEALKPQTMLGNLSKLVVGFAWILQLATSIALAI